MATKCINWLSSSCAPCAGQIPAEVILCVPASKLAPRACSTGEVNQTYGFRTLSATLTDVTREGCATPLYKYTFCYEDDLILDGQTLYGSDISGVFCKDCFVKWIEDLFGNEPFIRDNEDGTLTFVSNHGCEFTFVGTVPP